MTVWQPSPNRVQTHAPSLGGVGAVQISLPQAATTKIRPVARERGLPLTTDSTF